MVAFAWNGLRAANACTTLQYFTNSLRQELIDTLLLQDMKLLVFILLTGVSVAENTCTGSSENLTDNDCTALQQWVDDRDFTETLTRICPQVRADPCSCIFDRPVECYDGRVRQLRVGKQGLHGKFPEMLTKLTAMNWFDMAANNLTGTIPESLSQLTHLNFLALGTNHFSGTIPQSLTKLPLNDLGIDTNPFLTGHLPAFNFNSLPSCCALYDVPFECPLPPEAATCNHCNYHPVAPPSCHSKNLSDI